MPHALCKGQELQKEGEAEAEAARLQAKGEAAAERVEGKVQRRTEVGREK
jgi:hypothetical protein